MSEKIWLVEHPLHQYKEDVKKLARSNSLRIVDVSFAKSFPKEMVATDAPKLTKHVKPAAKQE